MTKTDLKLYELLGDKQEPTIADIFKWLNENVFDWGYNANGINVKDIDGFTTKHIDYDSSKSLLLQSEETKLAIISLITSYS